MLNSIVERRTVNDGLYSIVLEISADEYNNVYDQYDDEIASEILNHYLIYRDDDGRPSDIKIQHKGNSDIVRIFANLHYMGNDHTTYGR